MRLNKQIREQVLSNAVEKAGMYREAKKLCVERKEIAEKVLRTHLSKKEEARLNELIEEIEGFAGLWVNKNRKSSVTLACNGMRLRLNYSGEIASLVKSGLASGMDNVYNFGSGEIQSKDDFGAFKNQEAVESLVKRHEELKAQVMAILNKCSSSNQLIKIWPESEELIPKEKVGAGTALMVNTVELNTIIGLPTEKEQ